MNAELREELWACCANVRARVRQDIDVRFTVESFGTEQDCWSWRFSCDGVYGPKLRAVGVGGVVEHLVDFVFGTSANFCEMADLLK